MCLLEYVQVINTNTYLNIYSQIALQSWNELKESPLQYFKKLWKCMHLINATYISIEGCDICVKAPVSTYGGHLMTNLILFG